MDATTSTFSQDVLERSAELPVVVDFWADWCGPCKALTPVLEQEIEARAGRVELVKVDVDANTDLAREYAVQSIPAVKAFRNGRVVAEFVGARPAPMVAEFLDGLLGPTAGERLLDELRDGGSEPVLLEALEAGDHERALELLLAEARTAANADRRDEIRRIMVTLFEELGQDSELATRYRRQLATLLY